MESVRTSGPLKGIVGLAFLTSFCAFPLVTFLPVFARDVFGSDAKGYAQLLAGFGLGAVSGAIAVAGLQQAKRRGVLGVVMLAVFGLLMIAFSGSRLLPLSFLLLFGAGAALVTVFATFMTLVLINVWASWCGPCRAEMGSLDRLARRHNGRQFHVIGISTDDHADKAQAFVVGTGVSFDNYIDRNLVLENMLGASRIPLTVFDDKDGKVLRKVYGAREWDSAANKALIASTLGVRLD